MLNFVLFLHLALTEQLEEEQRARKQLEEKVEALKKANDEWAEIKQKSRIIVAPANPVWVVLCSCRARKSVDHAKRKVRQQAKQIRELEEKLQNNELEEHARKHAIWSLYM